MSLSKHQKKRIAVWAVFIAAVIALIAALIVYIRGTFRENDLHTQSVGDVKLSPVAEAYSGAEEILGTSITLKGDNNEQATLTFPETISKYQPENAYIITNIAGVDYDYEKGAEQLQADGPELFKIFYGDRFDESRVEFTDVYDGIGGHMITETYTDNNGSKMSYYAASGYTLIDEYQADYAEVATGSVLAEEYFLKDGPDVTAKLSDGTITVKEAADKFSDYLNNTLADFRFGFEVRPYKAQIYDLNGVNTIKIEGEQLYEGISFESCFSSLYISKNGKITSYMPAYIDTNMLSVNSFYTVSYAGSGIISKTEQLDSIISFKSAVEILKENLAKNADYTFIDIKLMYCCKHTQNEIQIWDEDKEKLKKLEEENNQIQREFRPTWYFIISHERGMTSGIKVDAVTGEITMDIP